MSHDTNNKVALVTGVSSGIGREIAQLLALRGLRVFGTVHDHPIVIPGVEVVRLDVGRHLGRRRPSGSEVNDVAVGRVGLVLLQGAGRGPVGEQRGLP